MKRSSGPTPRGSAGIRGQTAGESSEPVERTNQRTASLGSIRTRRRSAGRRSTSSSSIGGPSSAPTPWPRRTGTPSVVGRSASRSSAVTPPRTIRVSAFLPIAASVGSPGITRAHRLCMGGMTGERPKRRLNGRDTRVGILGPDAVGAARSGPARPTREVRPEEGRSEHPVTDEDTTVPAVFVTGGEPMDA